MPDRETIESQYNTLGTTISSLAKQYNTSQPTVRKWLIDYGIERKSHAEASIQANNRLRLSPPPYNQLLQDYKYNSIDWIERKYGVGQATVYQWLALYNIDAGNRMILTSERQRLLYTMLCDNIPNGNWVMNDRSTIYPQELDIVSHSLKIAFEYCGLYWHSEMHKKDDYHLQKLQRCESKGYRLVTVFESDDLDKIVSFCNPHRRHVGARECTVVYNQNLKQLEDRFHMMGHLHAKENVCLLHEGEIIAAMSFARSRYNTSAQWEMIRYTTSDIIVNGGAEKLFNAFVKQYQPNSVISYCDRRYGTGSTYKRLGFKFSHNTQPNYFYVKQGTSTLLNRQLFMKHKLSSRLATFDATQTERENMLHNGYYRIYDCGSSAWLWHK